MTNLQHERKLMRNEEIITLVNAYGPESKQEFMTHLKTKIRLREAKLKDLEQKRRVLKSRMHVKKTKTDEFFWVAPHTVGGFLLGTAATAFTNLPDVQFSMVVGGTILGAAAGFVNNFMYENKLVTNAVNKFKNYLNEKKITRLTEQQESDKMIADGIVPFEAQGDYPDAEAYSNY